MFRRKSRSESETTQNDTTVVNTSSPVNKRRGFSGRKWLPPPLRKLSQGKVDKTQAPLDSKPPLKKTGSDKRIKVPTTDMGNNKSSVSEGEEEDDRTAPLKGAKSLGSEITNGDEGDEGECELPPPMKPIQEPILVPQAPPGVPGVPEIEENPGKRIDAVDNAKKIESWLKKRHYVLQELIDTEEAYVRDLSLIVDGYIATMRDPDCEIPMPDDLREGKDKMVFGNIEAIYDWHKNHFLKSLKAAVENPEELAQLFRRYERKLQMYVIYCKNKPISEYIVAEHLDNYFEELRVKLGHKLQLCDLLIKPVQRIMKYQLMLKDILKYTERAGIQNEIDPLRAAYNIMVVVPKNANDMMDVGRLQGFESGKITAQGKLLLHGLLIVSDLPGINQAIVGKNKELQVFLFEQSIIFSEVVGKKSQFTSPQYLYKAHIQVNKMTLDEYPNLKDVKDEGSFVVRSDGKNSTDVYNAPSIGFVCLASSDELRSQWLKTIKDILQTQKDFLKAIQSPIAYQKELTKESSLFPWEFSSKSVDHSQENSPVKTPRKPPQYIHKANTIGIPSENDITSSDNSDSKNNNKTPRRHFFDGFRSTLKNRHKSDTMVMSQDKEDIHRRWSEAQPPVP